MTEEEAQEQRFGILGIDPGSANGAVALLTCDMKFEPIDARVEVLPTKIKPGTKRKRLNERGVVDLIDEMVGDLFIKLAVIEWVQAREGQSATAMWAFGEAVGFLRGVLTARGYTVMKVQPQSWQRSMGFRERLPTTSQRKRRSRELAQALCPELDLDMAKDSDKAEALLMAEHGRMWLQKQ